MVDGDTAFNIAIRAEQIGRLARRIEAAVSSQDWSLVRSLVASVEGEAKMIAEDLQDY